MRIRLILFLTILSAPVASFAQGAPPIKLNTVFVDWDTKQFKNELPVGEGFYLKVYSKTKGAIPTDLTLVRFLDTRYTFYYKEIPLVQVGTTQSDVKLNEPTKITRKQQLSMPVGVIDETKEYTNDPDLVYKNLNTYFVEGVDANFSYAVMRQKDYIDGTTTNKPLKDKIKPTSGPVNAALVPLTNTETERVNEKFVLPIVGVAYHPDQKFVIPYAGLRIALFSPINRQTLVRYREMKPQNGFLTNYLKRVAFDIGIGLASVEDATQNRKNLFGSSSLLVGLSYPLGGSGTYLSAGTTLFNYQMTGATEPAKIHSTAYVSLSFNIEVNPILQSFSKLVGVK